MILLGYPQDFAPQKPQQSITPDELKRVLVAGAVTTKKYNGHRVHIIVTQLGEIKFYSQNGTQDWTPYLPRLQDAFRSLDLPLNTFLDGELYVPSKEAVEAVQAIVNTGSIAKGIEGEARLQPTVAIFDVLIYNGTEIYKNSYEQRTQLIRQIIRTHQLYHVAAEVQIQDFDHAMSLVETSGWEGLVVADRSASAKVNLNGNTKRGSLWKLKIRTTEDLIATGFTPAKDLSLGVGSLNILRRVNGQWSKAGKVGSFEVLFDRHAATNATVYPMVVEVSHFGADEAGNLTFPKVVRARPDLHSALLPTLN